MARVVDRERIDPPQEAVERLGSVDCASSSTSAGSSDSGGIACAIFGRAVVKRLRRQRERLKLVEHAHGVVGPHLDGEAGGVRWPAAMDGAACSVERVE